jgi:hypothetical protein
MARRKKTENGVSIAGVNLRLDYRDPGGALKTPPTDFGETITGENTRTLGPYPPGPLGYRTARIIRFAVADRFGQASIKRAKSGSIDVSRAKE